MQEIMVGFSEEEIEMILKYQEVSEAVTIQAAVMNAISLALDHADE